jgi:hypothetical protein
MHTLDNLTQQSNVEWLNMIDGNHQGEHYMRRLSSTQSKQEMPATTYNAFSTQEPSHFLQLTPSEQNSKSYNRCIDSLQSQRYAHSYQSPPVIPNEGCHAYELPATPPYTPPTLPSRSSSSAEQTLNPEPATTPEIILELETAISSTEKNIMTHRVTIALYEQHLNTLKDQLFTLHLTQHAGPKLDRGAYQSSPKIPTPISTQSISTDYPHFLTPYLPALDLDPPNPNDAPDARRCKVGRPQGKMLRKDDRYYSLWMCDKHGSSRLFHENMMINRDRGREREQAWSCERVF